MTTFGYLAVDMFFIMSGFFLMYTFNNSLNVCDFIKKKIIRLWPMVVAYAVIDTLYQYLFIIPRIIFLIIKFLGF